MAHQIDTVHWFTDLPHPRSVAANGGIYLWKDGRRDSIPENRQNEEQRYTHDLFTDFTLDFIRRHHQEPFFLYVAYTIPHFNLEVPEIEPYAADTDWPEQLKILASMITRMDRDVGRIRSELEKLGIDRNTLIFFTSDNGPAYKKRAAGRDLLFDSNGLFKGAKGSLDEGGLRVPMVVCRPGTVPAGKVNDQPWYFADLLPTLAEISGSSIPENIDGQSVLPLLYDGEYKLPDRFMYWEEPPPDLDQGVRYGKWKARRTGGNGQPIAVYNLDEDPGEKFNVATEYPHIVEMFKEYLAGARTPSPYWPDETALGSTPE
jgi:arylsulfatase A-like enzyme